MVESLLNHPFQLPLLTEIPLIKNEKKSSLSLYLVYPEFLSDDLLNKLASILISYINKDPHMLSVSSKDVFDSIRQGLSVMVFEPNFLVPVGYAKFYPWKRERRSCWFRIRECICYTRISRLGYSKKIN